MAARPLIKAATPADFNGERDRGKAFMATCRTYIRLNAGTFANDDTKIIWAMSYMKSRRASRWAQRELATEASRGRLQFLDWKDFESEFRLDFEPIDATNAAVNKLEGDSYFQKRRTVDEYLDEFRDLIADSLYTDPRTTVVKFR